MQFSLTQNNKTQNKIKIIITYDVIQDRPISIATIHNLLKFVDNCFNSEDSSNDTKTSKNVKNCYNKVTHHLYSELTVSKPNFFGVFKKLIEKLYDNENFIPGSKLAANLLTVSLDADMFDKEQRLELFNLTRTQYPKLNNAFNLDFLLNKAERNILVFGFFRQEEPITTSDMSFYMTVDIQTLTANKFIC
jgi:hypothetical protein